MKLFHSEISIAMTLILDKHKISSYK